MTNYGCNTPYVNTFGGKIKLQEVALKAVRILLIKNFLKS